VIKAVEGFDIGVGRKAANGTSALLCCGQRQTLHHCQALAKSCKFRSLGTQAYGRGLGPLTPVNSSKFFAHSHS
jgi:hypothetical protein